MRLSLSRYLRRSPWCGRRTWSSTRSSWTGKSSCVSATPGICSSTPTPKRLSPTSCSSCCCASRPTWSPSPPSSSVPSRYTARPGAPRGSWEGSGGGQSGAPPHPGGPPSGLRF
uniref:Ciliogenesis associated TTC17 interacting protein n=1 Tax=Rousettus aegyptiacus TaxID=9407 RepID=A0A7J8JC18_ROUAE|nr:ciliogenesis associated TTC17 interacting protein [Rousettus aegyptiacus]